MNPKSSFTWALLPLGALLAIGFALYQSSRAREVGSAVAMANRRSDELHRQLQRAEARLRQAEQERAGREGTAVPATGGNAAGTLNAPSAASSGKSSPSEPFLRATDPKLRALYVKQFEDKTYWGARLFPLRLPPDRMEKMTAIYVERALAQMDLNAVVDAKGLTEDASVMRDMTGALSREEGTRAKALLSAEEYKQWLRSNGDTNFEKFGTALAGDVYLSDTPLTLEQREQLMQILRKNYEPPPKEKLTKAYTGFAVDFSRQDNIKWDAVLAQMGAAGFPPAQIAALRTYQENLRLDRQINQLTDSAIQRNPLPKRPELWVASAGLPPPLPRKKP